MWIRVGGGGGGGQPMRIIFKFYNIIIKFASQIVLTILV